MFYSVKLPCPNNAYHTDTCDVKIWWGDMVLTVEVKLPLLAMTPSLWQHCKHMCSNVIENAIRTFFVLLLK